jgi:hypothetical protein
MYTLQLTQSELDLLKQFCNSDIPIAAKGARVVAGLHAKLDAVKTAQSDDDPPRLPET